MELDSCGSVELDSLLSSYSQRAESYAAPRGPVSPAVGIWLL